MPPKALSPWSKRCLHRYTMPEQVRSRILDVVARSERRPLLGRIAALVEKARSRWAALGAGFAAGALAGALVLGTNLELASDESMAPEVVASHVRSLMADHLSDVASADGDAVRSWFRGKLDYAPRVIDSAAPGYALVGGRLDYVGGRAVAALVYRHAGTFVNVFSCPLGGKRGEDRDVARRGFNAVGWSDATMQYWAVADLDRGELQRFAQSLRRE